MTDTRERRIAVLTAAAKAKSQRAAHAADQAIRSLVKRGEPITFQSVQREAGVSHAFLYKHSELRRRIDYLRGKHLSTTTARPIATDENPLVITLTQQITELKRRHRQQTQALRDALEQAHGENLDLRREMARRGNTQDTAESIETTT
jgi:hypothetical protein